MKLRLYRATTAQLAPFGGVRGLCFDYVLHQDAIHWATALAEGLGFRFRVCKVGAMWRVLPA